MADSLHGKSAIVTGGGSGINLAFVIKLLERGVNVLIADLALRLEAQEVVDKYNEEPRALFEKTDVTSWKELTDMFDRAKAEFGRIDIVCPGAGVFEPPFSGFWYPPGCKESIDDPFGDGYKTLDINLVHPIRLTQLAISHFLTSTVASNPSNIRTIVHIASIASESAALPFPLYHATKWGLAGFVRSLKDLESRYGIRVAAVAPGTVHTPLWTDNKDKMTFVTKEGTSQTWIPPEYVAECMLNIVLGDENMQNPDASPITVTGGLVLEVGASHVREIPLYGNLGPDPALAGMAAVNGPGGHAPIHALLGSPGWGHIQ